MRETDAAFRARHLVCGSLGSRNPLEIPVSRSVVLQVDMLMLCHRKMYTHRGTGRNPGRPRGQVQQGNDMTLTSIKKSSWKIFRRIVGVYEKVWRKFAELPVVYEQRRKSVVSL